MGRKLPAETLQQHGIRSIVATAIAESFSRVKFDATQWAMEVRAIAQAAAVEGDYSIALDAYKILGRHVGATVDEKAATTQHLHVHGAMDEYDRTEASDEELQERMAEILKQQATLVEVEAIEEPEDGFFES